MKRNFFFVQNKPWKAEEARRLEQQGGGGGKKVDKEPEDVRSPSATEASYSVRCKIHEVFSLFQSYVEKMTAIFTFLQRTKTALVSDF